MTPAANLVLNNARITMLDRANPVAIAIAIGGGRILAVGTETDVMAYAGSLRSASIPAAGG